MVSISLISSDTDCHTHTRFIYLEDYVCLSLWNPESIASNVTQNVLKKCSNIFCIVNNLSIFTSSKRPVAMVSGIMEYKMPNNILHVFADYNMPCSLCEIFEVTYTIFWHISCHVLVSCGGKQYSRESGLKLQLLLMRRIRNRSKSLLIYFISLKLRYI
jgi:hypothetical protein